MSESAGRPSSVSSVSSVSLLEIKAETHLILQAFLQHSLDTPQKDRPGRVGGAYNDHNKYSSKPQSRSKDGHDPQAEEQNEKKSGLRDFIKQLPRNAILRSKGSLGRNSSMKKQSQQTEDSESSTSSDEEDSEKKRKQKQLKIRKKLSLFFKKKAKEKDKEEKVLTPQRPANLPVDVEHGDSQDMISPTHPPEFYSQVAEKLERLARSSSKIKTQSPELNSASSNDLLIQQLAQLVSSQGDSINTKIESDPFLRSSLNRLSYGSFARILDFFGSSQVSEAPPVQPAASPTLRRMAVTMEVSRRIVTATGAQRMEGFAERYMENFVPWVKKQGGWENLVELEELVEYD